MTVEAFPELAVNLIYTVLCLVPGFITLKTALYRSDIEMELDQFDKSTWSLIGSGISLSALYFMYLGWSTINTGRLRLHVSINLQWTDLVAIYPLLVVIAFIVGYLIGLVINRTETVTAGVLHSEQ